MRRPFLPVLICILGVVWASAAPAADKVLRPPFDIADIRATKGEVMDGRFECLKSPPPMRDLDFESFYKNEQASEIDKQAYRDYKDQYKPLQAFEQSITDFANLYLRSNPPRKEYAICTLKWLHDWEEEGALLGKVSHNGEFIRKWVLASASLAYVQIKDEPSLNTKKKREVEIWLRDVAQAALIDFSIRMELNSRQNNHLYWAAWGVGMAGVAVQEPKFYHWAMSKTRQGIGAIDEDGTLPRELFRGERALQYHLYAAMPLVMLAELSAVNGRDLYELHEGRLHKLVDRALGGIEDPSYIAEKAGAKQDMGKVKMRGSLAWVEAYDTRFPERQSARIQKLRKELPPLSLSRLGGDTALLYGD